jgi:4-azaleucine resistance transporter AzlC
MTARSSLYRTALAAAWPICLGYIPIGLSLGVLAQKAGLSPLATGFMSVMVFAGGSQFIAVAMLAAGAAPAAIILTTFMVNLRHLLMSAALAQHLTECRRTFLALFAYGITDESFAVNLGRFREEGSWSPLQALALNQLANAAWICSTIAGALVGQLIPAKAFGIDYALTAMFLCLLVYQLRSRLHVLTAILAGGVSLAFYLAVPGNTYIIVAAVSATTLGYLVKRRFSLIRRAA